MQPGTELPVEISPKTCYVVRTTTLSVDERFRQRYISGMGDSAVFERISLGWYALFDGSYDALYLGVNKPEIKAGDKVKITIEVEHDDLPNQPPI